MTQKKEWKKMYRNHYFSYLEFIIAEEVISL